MVTDSKEYFQVLYEIQDTNPPSIAILLPGYEPFYEIDLDTRIINAPEFLSVNKDHRSETVYFKVPRHHDGVDLATMCCVIQYINADGEGRVYAVPYYDVDTFVEEDKILFPWVIDGEATKSAGDVQFSVRFFKLDTSGSYLMYNLNTLPAKAAVQHGIEMTYDEVYEKIELSAATYRKGVYYILNKNRTFELATENFDASQTYYDKHVIDVTAGQSNWTATFLDQMIYWANEAANHDLTWLVL